MDNPLFNLKTGRFRFICKRQSDIDFHKAFCGRLRGNIGFLIKKNCCLFNNFRSRACAECIMAASCPYPKLFDPQPPPPTTDGRGRLRTTHPPPRPFALSVTGDATDNSLLKIDICLFGPALEESSFFLDMAGKSLLSIHMDGHPFLSEIVEMQTLRPEKPANSRKDTYIYSLADWIDSTTGNDSSYDNYRYRVALAFLSPFCHKKINGTGKTTQKILPEILLKAVIRRLRDLKRAYGKDTNMGKLDNHLFRDLKNISCARNSLYPDIGSRYSYRQQKAINLAGISGRIEYNNIPSAMLPFLLCCQLIQVGKGTSWGLGNIVLTCNEPLGCQ